MKIIRNIINYNRNISKRHYSIMAALDKVKDVDIDEGKYKYILIKVKDKDSSKFIVRGYKWAAYHADILEGVSPDIKNLGLKCNCVGGGRILHKPNDKSIKIYGYSQGFGRADHTISHDLVKKVYPDYNVTWSNDGY